ncbi:MAG: spore cortex-lytic enzyme [Christensenellaceae bacterium]
MKKIILVTALILMFGMTLAISLTTVNAMNESAFTEEALECLTLKQGSRGQDVRTLQQKLKNWGYYTGAVDGIYGAKTKSAVIYFQKKNGLVADGIVGTKTLQALGMSTGSTSTGNNTTYSNSDVQLLARLVTGEARGESYTGQVAVAAVVLNRVKSSSFPNTISGVIYQPYAFTAVADGQINLQPTQSCLKAAQAAMNGQDPSGGAIYYYNPKTATSQWIYSRKTTTTIGNHVFAI